ncbi:MAG: TolC family protein [Thiohalorhabdus sp.]|uniref:TolC family protein n=1 Tax=Thiohalorhabdus sp. TaxID=3094134 RepID=UPI00398039EB
MVIKHLLRILPVGLLGAALAPGAAQGLELREAVRQALENNSQVQAQRHQQEAAGYRTEASRSGYLPMVDLEVGARATNSPAQAFMAKLNQGDIDQSDFGDPAGDPYGTLNDPDTTSDLATALVLRQPLYRGGATSAEVRRARSNQEAMSRQADRTRLDVALGATKAFLQVQLAEARVAVTEEALKAAREHLRIAENRLETGAAMRGDMLQARTRVSELEEQLLAHRNEVAVAKSALNERLGRDLDAPVSLDRDLGEDLPAEAPGLEVLVERAIAKRPTIAATEAELGAARAGVDAASAELLPRINLEARLEDHRASAADQSWLAGVRMDWRLFGGGRWASRNAAEAERFAARAQLTDIRRKVRLEVKQAKLDLDTARRRLDTVGHAVASARESLRTNTDRYRQGAATMVEVLDAQLARQQARLRQLEAFYDLRLSHARLQKAVGQTPVLDRLAGSDGSDADPRG